MTKSVLLVLVLAALAASSSSAASSPCSSYTTCAECLGDGLFCGWCSPAPTVYNNGTQGFQCQDQHESGWHCNHLYSTGTCKKGYACNATAGQCYETEAGQGDTKENCEKTCKKTPPQPKDLSFCNLTTLTCEPCNAYCKTDTDCPNSYCQDGLCHGSTCQSNATCGAQCSNDTPDELLGTWRGILISTGFDMGEFDFKFQKRSDGPQVTFKGPGGAVSTGSVTSTVGTRDLTLTYSAGPLSGSTYNGGYDAWEPASPDTLQMGFYFGAPSQPKPDTLNDAMAGKGDTVYVMSKCDPHADEKKCDFASVFSSSSKRMLKTDLETTLLRGSNAVTGSVTSAIAGFLRDVVVAATGKDPCSVHPTCGECIADPSNLCGWCDSPVTYDDNSTGTQCAGFDSSGKPLGWTCNGTFHKDSCADYGCDWSDIENPTCKECNDKDNCTMTKDKCAANCKPPPELYKCDNATKTCKPCKSSYCTKDADCPGSYCQKSGFGPWQCHGGSTAGCSDNSTCSTNCPVKPQNESYYKCDQYSGQCQQVDKNASGATTQYECEHECKAAAPTGTWRGVEVSHGFARGEFDFTFYDDATVHWRDASGKTYVAQFDGLNLTKAQDGTVTVGGNVTKSDDSSKLPVGTVVDAAFRMDVAGNDGVAQFLFWGQSTDGAPVQTFDDAMLKSAFVLVACKEGQANCDFSSATV
eukprot:g874.t1